MIEVLISEGADLDRGTRSEGLTDWSYPTVIFIIFYPRHIRVSKKSYIFGHRSMFYRIENVIPYEAFNDGRPTQKL